MDVRRAGLIFWEDNFEDPSCFFLLFAFPKIHKEPPAPSSHPGNSLFNNDYYERKLETEDRQVYEGCYLGVVQIYKARPNPRRAGGSRRDAGVAEVVKTNNSLFLASCWFLGCDRFW